MADDPHMALLPHIALPAQTVPKPSEVLDPHIAEDPHMADDPHIAELDVTNCELPQTAELPHMADVPQTEDGSEDMYALPVVGSKFAVGDIALPLATSVLFNAASRST